MPKNTDIAFSQQGDFVGLIAQSRKGTEFLTKWSGRKAFDGTITCDFRAAAAHGGFAGAYHCIKRERLTALKGHLEFTGLRFGEWDGR